MRKMSLDKLNLFCNNRLSELKIKGVQKGSEKIISGILAPEWIIEGRLPDKAEDQNSGLRILLEGSHQKFLIMNSNSYLGLSNHPEVKKSEESGAESYGAGPGAVRFISGTYKPHVDLENQLAGFHFRDSAIIFSAAYAAVMGVLPALIDDGTLVVSDELNHNCIINAVKLSRPAKKEIFRHLDMAHLEKILVDNVPSDSGDKIDIRRVLIVTDGIFSMRGDYAPLDKIEKICKKYEEQFKEGIILIVDDSHGVGAFGKTGRGTEEYCSGKADILISTLGKALGVNGGYVVSSRPVIEYLRESSPFYIYSNPITPSEAMAASRSMEILNSSEGLARLEKIRQLKSLFETGLIELGFETIPGEHPITPLMIRDTMKTMQLTAHLFKNNILATGLNYPVVPKGSEEIRFQVNANHTFRDIEYVLEVLKTF